MSSKDIYKNIILKENINLTPRDINYNIDEILKKKLADKVEGRCIKEGYVKPDSVEIISRTLGHLINSNFSGTINYVIKYSADVCVLSKNQIVTCEVFSTDKSSKICYIGDPKSSPVEIYLNKQHHINNLAYNNLEPEDIIKVKIAAIVYEFKYDQMVAIAELVEKV